jgi:hypothetical protein
VVYLDIYLHQLIDVERCDSSGDGHAYGVAKERYRVMILEKLWILRQYWALLRRLDVGLQLDHSVLTGVHEHITQHLQILEIESLAEPARQESAYQAFDDCYEDGKGIRDEERSERRASDDHELSRLHENEKLAVFHHVPGEDRPENRNNSDNCKQDALSLAAH